MNRFDTHNISLWCIESMRYYAPTPKHPILTIYLLV